MIYEPKFGHWMAAMDALSVYKENHLKTLKNISVRSDVRTNKAEASEYS